jgi:hypothetical protein
MNANRECFSEISDRIAREVDGYPEKRRRRREAVDRLP